jgi:short-subunit dehydrogenase
MAPTSQLEQDFADHYGPWALIAGGSEGIGESFARYLAAAGINLVLIARRELPLQQLADRILAESPVQIRTLSADLTDTNLLPQICAVTNDIEVGLLIYNAGATIGYKAFHQWQQQDLEFMLRLNCVSPTLLAHHFSGPMVKRGRGGIMLLTSAAAFAGSAHMAIYPATKAFDHILAEGLWRDLKPYGVDALALVVGATRTPSHKDVDFSKFNPNLPDGGAMCCDDVALEGLQQLGDGPTWIVGEHNRARYPEDFAQQRRDLVEMMSWATAAINNLEQT